MKFQFHGAAQTVTGPSFSLWSMGIRYFSNAACFRARGKKLSKRTELQIRPAKVDALVLSHAHIDHSGNIPNLVRHGFRGASMQRLRQSIYAGSCSRIPRICSSRILNGSTGYGRVPTSPPFKTALYMEDVKRRCNISKTSPMTSIYSLPRSNRHFSRCRAYFRLGGRLARDRRKCRMVRCGSRVISVAPILPILHDPN